MKAAVGAGSPGNHAVSSVVSGLEPNTLYLVRAVASTGAGDVVSSPTGFMTDTSAPRIELTYAEEVGQTEARLGAHIDPEGTPTSYHFEWGTQPCSDIPNPCTELRGPRVRDPQRLRPHRRPLLRDGLTTRQGAGRIGRRHRRAGRRAAGPGESGRVGVSVRDRLWGCGRYVRE